MSLQYHFLIATSILQDSIFRHSVAYICEHDTSGVVGIIVNKSLENLKTEGVLGKSKIMPKPCDESVRLDKPVMLGGSLVGNRGSILHTPPPNSVFSICISDDIMITTSCGVLKTLGTDK